MICGALQTLNEDAYEDVASSERPSPSGIATGEMMNMLALPEQPQHFLDTIRETLEYGSPSDEKKALGIQKRCYSKPEIGGGGGGSHHRLHRRNLSAIFTSKHLNPTHLHPHYHLHQQYKQQQQQQYQQQQQQRQRKPSSLNLDQLQGGDDRKPRSGTLPEVYVTPASSDQLTQMVGSAMLDRPLSLAENVDSCRRESTFSPDAGLAKAKGHSSWDSGLPCVLQMTAQPEIESDPNLLDLEDDGGLL